MEDCPLLLATIEPLRRTKVIESLLVSRMNAKSDRVLDIWQQCKKDWNQVLFTMAAYALCAPNNSAQAQELAQVATLHICLRESSSKMAVEALLLGCSGLLDGEYYDNYIVELQKEFRYLANKYSLKPLPAGQWQRRQNYPAGNPVMRLVQLAALVTKPTFSFDDMVGCKTYEQACELLDVEVSEYWQAHFTPQGAHTSAPRRIGRSKVAMMVINMVVPLQIAYATVMGKHHLKQSALELLDTIPAENNRVVARWTGAGVACHSAYDSQALIELQSLCNARLCEQCPIEKQLRK